MHHRGLFRFLTIGVLVCSTLLPFHAAVLGSAPADDARAGLAYVFPAFANTSAITINDSPGSGFVATATPYPSTISVSGVVGSITNVSVHLSNLTHPTVGDIDMVLVGPSGAGSILMSDVGGANPVSSISFTLDQGGIFLPSPPADGGVYQPRDSTSTLRCALDSFPAPGPGTIPTANLGNFNGLSGASVNGTWSLYIVDDCTGNTGSLGGGWSLTITTDGTAPSITSAAPAGGTVGTLYSHTYTADGTTPITYSVTSGSLPGGLTLDPSGALGGTPTTGGTFTGVVTASNGIAPNDTQAFSITVASPPSITSAAPPNGTVGAPYTHTYTADGTTPISYSVTSGGLPDGLTLDPGGALSGTPTTTGNFTGIVTATNGIAPDDTQPFDITISPAPASPLIISAAPPDGTVGTAYSHLYTALGDATITFSVTSGSLPDGLTLDPGGALSGTPTTVGTFSGVVTAANGVTPDDTQPFDITISATRPPDSGGGEDHPYVPTAADHARAQAPLCADVSGKTSAIIRAVVTPGTVTDGSVFCRVLAENGSFLVDPAQIGSAEALSHPVSQAVDVFGLLHNGASQPHFNSPVQVCLQGSGTFLFLDATLSPRTVAQLPAWLEGGYTCASIPNAGTALLVQGPAASAPAPATGGVSQSLGSCTVTTLHIVNLRTGADVNSAVLQMVPYDVTLTAFQRQGDWFNVDYLGVQGWVNAAFVAPNGACG